MRVRTNGAELHYSTLGTGSTCLILSAIGTKPYIRMTSAALASRQTLVYVDLRGGGQSTGSAADLTFDVLAADLEAIRLDLGVERVAVLGHSVLGILAIEYGRRCPHAVSHVVAVGTPPFWDLPKLASDSARFFDADASDLRKSVLKENMARLPQDATPGQGMLAQTPMRFFDPRFDAASVFVQSEVRPELLKHMMGTLLSGWDIRAGSESLRVPLLIAQAWLRQGATSCPRRPGWTRAPLRSRRSADNAEAGRLGRLTGSSSCARPECLQSHPRRSRLHR